MKNKCQLQTAPLNRAADLLAEKGRRFSAKTARQLRSPFVPEIHMVGGGSGADAIGELFKACGWLVIYEVDKPYEKKKLAKGNGRRLQSRKPGKSKRTKRRS